MVQVTVNVNYQGKSYLTNVIAKRGAAEEEIMKQALEQVKKQWP